MNYKEKRILKLFIIAAIILVSCLVFNKYGINLGLDLRGGSHIVLQARPTEQREIDDTLMSGLINIIERRVNSIGLAEAVVQREGKDKIIVELPAVEDPNQALETIGKTAVLTFRNPQGQVLMTGEAIANAQAIYDQYRRAVVSFELTSAGSKRFEEITRQYINQRIGIYLDDDLLTNPVVESVIRGGGQITGYNSLEEAHSHAVLIKEGALPVPVDAIEARTVGPTLGAISIRKSLTAGIIGLILVGLYMIFMYRFPGILAAVVLAIYGLITLGTLAGFRAVLTLPGIAGIILSIGMAVDANIIIFERIKDERRSGKTIRTSIDSGFKRSYTAILDANITTIITALILAYFTSGTVRGFAITLGIGVVISMFTAFFITRNIIELFTNSKLLDNPGAFGLRRGQ